MPILLETDDFEVKAHDKPHHSRENGGHVVITPKTRYAHRYEMPLELASMMMGLSQVLGEAFTNAMRSKGVDIVRINYQDNGNWAYKEPTQPPHLHLHLYARADNERHPTNDARFQPFPNALVFPDRETGFYEAFKPLSREECSAIVGEFQRLLSGNRYEPLKETLGTITFP